MDISLTSLCEKLKPLWSPFRKAGFQIYLVGGAVRDLVRGQSPGDFDFTTDALPSEVQSLFRRVLPTGIAHGTVTVMLGREAYEVTTFRFDGDYSDHRRPDRVTFTRDLAQDLERRDFTVNALALNLETGDIVDRHEGQKDLARGLLRAIGQPELRFTEDALRILRLCRFAARFGFEVDPETWAAAEKLAPTLARVSAERIHEELQKLTRAPRADLGWRLLSGLNLPQTWWPGWRPLRAETETQLVRVPAEPAALRWVLVFAPLLSQEASRKALSEQLHNQRFTKLFRLELERLGHSLAILAHTQPDRVETARLMQFWGSREAEGLWTAAAALACLAWEGLKPPKVDLWRRFWASLAGHPVFLKDLAVNGKTVLDGSGWSGGPWMGTLLQNLLEQVWADPSLNQPARLQTLARNWLTNSGLRPDQT